MEMMSINTAQNQVIDAQAAAAKNKLKAAAAAGDDKAREAAEQFEAIFISQMLAPMFETVSTDGPMSGGHAETVYRSMMVEEVGKSIAKRGGIGIADQVYRELLKMQEA